MQLGKYQVLDEIGRGGMGAVYRGYDPVLQRYVAIKTIDKDGSAEFATRLLNEARAAALLTHPNIVEIYDFGEDKDTLYIVMELLQGESLRGVLQNQKLQSRQLLRILKGVADALDFAHSKGVVHRDMKPSNVMLLANEHAKLVDFGVAQVRSVDRLTMAGTILGTPQYMSPEQIRGETVDGRADQFALAAIAFEALTGRGPFESESFATVLFRITSGDLPSASAKNPELPGSVDEVLHKGMSVQAAHRYESCAAFVKALEAAISGSVELPRAFAPAPALAPARTMMLEPQAAPAALPNVTMLASAAPQSFVDAFPKTGFFSGDQVRFNKIEESFRFFRDNLQKQYESLSRQADVVWKLWAACVGIGFLVLATGLIILFVSNGEGALTKGMVTAAASVLVYYIQRLFQQREDHYRHAAEEKNSHLEYGNKWLLVIQTVDAIQDPGERKRQQARIAEALTEQLSSGRVVKPTPVKGPKRAKKQAAG